MTVAVHGLPHAHLYRGLRGDAGLGRVEGRRDAHGKALGPGVVVAVEGGGEDRGRGVGGTHALKVSLQPLSARLERDRLQKKVYV